MKSRVKFADAAASNPENAQQRKGVRDVPGVPSTVATLACQFHSKDLRSNLMREQIDRDPLFFYEVISVLGVGSMGSVAKVKKRSSVVGGSARKEIQDYFKQRKRVNDCYQIPLIGGLFRYCIKPPEKFLDISEDYDMNDHSNYHPIRRVSSANSSVLQPRARSVEDYNEPHSASDDNNLSTNSSNTNEQVYAMKSIHLSRVADPTFVEELQNEIQILRSLDHPHIVRPIETFLDRNQLFIVMELCTGGDLYARDPYTEFEAARITSSILSAISYMHSRNICHRDLKYENILFVNSSPKAEIKLIDFGLSKFFGNDELTDGVGTIYTMSPEVLKGSYTKQADLWSVGVITYMLLSSQMPFYGRKRRHIVEQIMAGQFDFKGRRWKRVSSQAKSFVSRLLVVDPEERATAEDASSDLWLNKRYAATVRDAREDELDRATQSLVKFSNYSKLKKVALMVIAHKSTSEEIGILRKVFQKYDTKRHGMLTYEEFKHAFDAAGLSEDDCKRMFDAVDLDGSGRIRYTEFLAATIEAHGAISEERLAEAFDRLDSDDSGYITTEDLKEILGQDFPQHEIDEIISEADLEKDGRISYGEFLALWEDKHEKMRHEVLEEIAIIQSTRSATSSERSNVSSDWSYSDDNITDSDRPRSSDPLSLPEVASRANFIEEKTSVARRQAVAASKTAAKSVFFKDEVTTIPDRFHEADFQSDADPDEDRTSEMSGEPHGSSGNGRVRPWISATV